MEEQRKNPGRISTGEEMKTLDRIRTEEEKIIERGATAVIKFCPVRYASPFYDFGEKMIIVKIF